MGRRFIYNAGTPTSVNSNIHYTGETYQGGVIFYTWSGGTEGLISMTYDLGPSQWGCRNTDIPFCERTAIGGGQANTAAIIANCLTSGIAARLADNLSLSGYTDWYLPSIDELDAMAKLQTAIGGFGTRNYWTSTEGTNQNTQAQYIYVPLNIHSEAFKDDTALYTRAIRRF